ncbi:hypothetical protein [Lentzea jiangxiensis]|uniref:Uncharacterized protein n=1 Tax=Lentzea jiangxiensis TaxID=641025 RepID=A0A1H0X064_9PSEU|nr:hypothetical protein [Lentzea jiangxiensis]SDP96358.1 hypothetical protein SAMN05421507_12746 [Lentzea jiangxiensis]
MEADASKDFDNRSPFTWRATTTAAMSLISAITGISIVTSSGEGIGWLFLALALVGALIAALIFRLARKSRQVRSGANGL